MHINQQKLLELARKENLAVLTLQEISEKIGISSPQLVQHHIDQLVKKGFIWIDRRAGAMKLLTEEADTSHGLLRIPIVGAANCGQAMHYADESVINYLSISSGLLGLKDGGKYYALVAVGNSMNNAKIVSFGGQRQGIDNGDLVIVEPGMNIPNNNDYIVSVIDGLANIKKFVREDSVIKLVSESTETFPPIYVNPARQEYFISGMVKGVIKQ